MLLVVREALIAFVSTDAGGVEYVNTLAVKSDPVGIDSNEQTAGEFLAAVDDWLADAYRAVLSDAYTLVRLQLVGILGWDAEGSRSIAGGGTLSNVSNVGAPIPREVAAIITWKTGTHTRSGRGRIFVPAPADAHHLASRNAWNTGTAYWSGLEAFAGAVLEGWDTPFETPDVHLSGRVYSRVDAVTRDITSYIVRLEPHWLRSRASAP